MTVRITGKFNEVMVFWSPYTSGMINNLDPVDPISRIEIVDIPVVIGGNFENEDQTVIDAVETHKIQWRGFTTLTSPTTN